MFPSPSTLSTKNETDQCLKLSHYGNNAHTFRNPRFNVSSQLRSKLTFCLLRRHTKYFTVILGSAFRTAMEGEQLFPASPYMDQTIPSSSGRYLNTLSFTKFPSKTSKCSNYAFKWKNSKAGNSSVSFQVHLYTRKTSGKQNPQADKQSSGQKTCRESPEQGLTTKTTSFYGGIFLPGKSSD